MNGRKFFSGVCCAVLSLAALLVLSLIAVPASAQEAGTILGVVKDSSGGAVPQAKITITNTDTNETREVTTGDDGAFRVPALRPGHYSVKVEKEGFKTSTQTALTLDVAQQLVVNPSLEVGSSTQEVTVTGEAPVVNTTTSTLGALVDDQHVADLPLNGRNYHRLDAHSAGHSDQHQPFRRRLGFYWDMVQHQRHASAFEQFHD